MAEESSFLDFVLNESSSPRGGGNVGIAKRFPISGQLVVTLASRTPWNTVALRCIPRNNATPCCLLPLAVFRGQSGEVSG